MLTFIIVMFKKLVIGSYCTKEMIMQHKLINNYSEIPKLGHNTFLAFELVTCNNYTGESDEESEEDGVRGSRRRDEFIENPALVRQRQEARREAERYRRGVARQPQQQPKQYDVIGNTKGQGQEKDTLRNRLWKEKNKATRVHHNRKVLADKKRKF